MYQPTQSPSDVKAKKSSFSGWVDTQGPRSLVQSSSLCPTAGSWGINHSRLFKNLAALPKGGGGGVLEAETETYRRVEQDILALLSVIKAQTWDFSPLLAALAAPRRDACADQEREERVRRVWRDWCGLEIETAAKRRMDSQVPLHHSQLQQRVGVSHGLHVRMRLRRDRREHSLSFLFLIQLLDFYWLHSSFIADYN